MLGAEVSRLPWSRHAQVALAGGYVLDGCGVLW